MLNAIPVKMIQFKQLMGRPQTNCQMMIMLHNQINQVLMATRLMFYPTMKLTMMTTIYLTGIHFVHIFNFIFTATVIIYISVFFLYHTHRQKTTQNLCEVEIKDESSSNIGGGSNFETQATSNDDKGTAEKPSKKQKRNSNDDLSFSPFSNPLTTSFDVLNLLRNSSFATNSALGNKYTDEIQLVVEMQAKEHSLRMTILQTQLETAKLNRDIAEINKILLLRNFQNIQD